jgi:2'-5' RNA ligase
VYVRKVVVMGSGWKQAYSYGCVMIQLPKPLADRVIRLASVIPDELLFEGNEDAPGGRAETPHVTVKYGIQTFDPEDISSAVEMVEPFVVTIGRCGVFHGEKSIVLRLAIESPGLMALNRQICSSLKHMDTFREYRPHVTIAYMVKKDKDPYYYREFYNNSLEGEKFGADQLIFTTKVGNRYVIPLNGSKSKLARRVASAERVTAKMIEARLDVRISSMEKKIELSDGRQTAKLEGRPYEVEKLAKDLKWDVTKLTRMNLREAQEFIGEKMGSRKLRWRMTR